MGIDLVNGTLMSWLDPILAGFFDQKSTEQSQFIKSMVGIEKEKLDYQI